MLKSPAHGNGIEALLKLAKRATLNKHSSFKLITHHHWWHQGKRPGLPRKQSQQISPFYEGLFRGMLILFLLEIGITASRQIKAFRQVGPFMAGFGVIMPMIHGVLGVTLPFNLLVGLPVYYQYATWLSQ